MVMDAAVLERVGRTPEARVRWFLKFAAQDLARLSGPLQKAAWDALFALQSQQPVRVPAKQETVAETQQELRACIEALANGRRYDFWVPGMSWTLRPPPPRPPGTRDSAPVVRDSAEAQIMRAAMPATIVLAFVDDLNAIGADRLRACPLETSGKRCGLIFLATRRQRYCGRRHAQAAAWQAYSIKRKERRK